MEIENSGELEISSKKDDFFDEDPGTHHGDSTPINKDTEAMNGESEGDKDKESGDATLAENNVADGETRQEPEATSTPALELEHTDEDQKPEAEAEGGEENVAAEATEEPADKGFMSTSPPAREQPGEDREDGIDTGIDNTEQPPAQAEATEEKEDPCNPEEGQEPASGRTEHSEEAPATAVEEDAADGTAAVEKHESEQQETAKEEAEPEVVPFANGEMNGKREQDQESEYKYDDDRFSVQSEHSLASIDSNGKRMNQKIEVQEDQKPGVEHEINQPELVNGRTSSSPSPSQSRTDSRAEAIGAVDPAPAPPEEAMKLDDRSSLTDVRENGEYRGEDRTDMTQAEGTEDSRGQGQWKSAEQQYIASAVMAHKSEQEALKEVEGERDKLVEDNQELKKSLESVEHELASKCDLLVAEREISAARDKKIKQLSEELSLTSSKLGEGNEERIKDLQERLAVLARECEEKDKRINVLEGDLRTTKAKLKQTEDRLEDERTQAAKAIASASAGNGDVPKSKTCAIM